MMLTMMFTEIFMHFKEKNYFDKNYNKKKKNP